ncbi:polysaccharide lyase family protein [Flavobacterium cellulosilyticum]|uniref:rhamnogalacturonan endolyase n=1 Tax=Flavobacterium cellulosilyticum TaxID=2541731 RepID=A0A4R5CBW5_9FLAO|nr:polysaccharide lyase family protein [Flavobacterium cellulosilyticum]TDD95713.1 T9SS type A sorting domain-containing protein [Flavobacterium cellulosilyticum]
MNKTLLTTKNLLSIITILFLSIINTGFAQTYTWVGGVSTDFYNASNWDNTTLSYTDIQSYTFEIGAGTPNNLIHVGGSASDITKRPGRFNTSANANVILKGNLLPWNSDNLNGTITLESPANINIRNIVYLGKSANATLNVNGGAIYSKNAFYIGYGTGGNATANIAGGAVYVGTYLEVGTGTGNPIANLNITGGAVNVPTGVNIGTNGQIYISGIGLLVVNGDKQTVLQGYINTGKIKCPSGKTLAVSYDGAKTTVNIPQDSNSMLTEYPTYILLKNGIIEAKIEKNTSNLMSMKINGVETLYQSTATSRTGGYYDFVTSQGFEQISGATFSVKEETADYIDVSLFRPYTPGTNVTRCDVDIHYVLKKGDTGLYTYSILRHKAAYPDFDLGSWRQVLWIDSSITDKICVNDLKTWQMPQPTDAWSPTSIPEIIKIDSGVRAGKYDGKYEFSEPLISLKAYGHTSDKNSLGIWAVTANHEYFNSGPTHHDLNAAAGIIHICMNGVHYNSKGFQVLQNEEWSKIYGPYLIYGNQKSTATANWDDAKTRAAKDELEWPFSWLTNTPEYPLAAGRGNIKGNFSIKDNFKPNVTGKNAWIGVTQLSDDSTGQWQFEEENYQYWVKTDASGNFDIKNVRPGSYTLFAYSDGVTDEFSMTNVIVTAGGTNNLGNVVWSKPRTNGSLVWDIGVPDRTAGEYKFGDFDYCEGFIQKKFDTTFPNPINYNVADKNWSTALPYVHSKYYNADGTINGNWLWKINFDMPVGMPNTGNAKLTIAYASSDHAQQWIYINTESGTPIAFYPPLGGGNAFLRQSNHAKYATTVVDIPMSKLHAGSNYIQLVMPSNSGDVSHLMYDYISFEAITNANDLDNDGVVNANDTCPSTPAGEIVGLNGCSSAQLGVASNTLTADAIRAYPNPTKGIFEITLPLSIQETTIELYSVQMQSISKKSYPVNNGKVQLNIENQAKGVYFIKVGLTNSVILKIIKE